MPCKPTDIAYNKTLDYKSMTDKIEGQSDRQPNLGDLMSLHEAAQISGLSHGHLALLIRRGQLWGIKLGRNWVTTRKSIDEYLVSDRRPGPKNK